MLSGKTVLITGGSRGIGRAITLKMAENGANVAVIYHGSLDAADEVCGIAASRGVRAAAYKCNVADFAEVKSAVALVMKDFGGIDVLVNNAGINRDSLVFTMTEHDYDAVLNTNLKGAFNFIKHTYAQFVKRRSGSIINISSVVGLTGNAGQANYAASKAGLIGLTKSVARELAARGIRCNAIAPGYIVTDMTGDIPKEASENYIMNIPLKRPGAADDVAELALFLASDKSAYITGETVRVDGGLAI